ALPDGAVVYVHAFPTRRSSDLVWHWLLHSPFDRNHGTIRRKALGVYGYKHASAAFQTDVAKLKALCYHIIRLQDDHLHVKSSALEIDSLLCYQNPLPKALYKLIMIKLLT